MPKGPSSLENTNRSCESHSKSDVAAQPALIIRSMTSLPQQGRSDAPQASAAREHKLFVAVAYINAGAQPNQVVFFFCSSCLRHANRSACEAGKGKLVRDAWCTYSSPIVDLHGNESDELIPLDLGQLTSDHIRHFV